MSKGLRVSTLLLEEPTAGRGKEGQERPCLPRESLPPYHADVLDLGCYYSTPSSPPADFVHIGILLHKFGPFLYVRDMDGGGRRPSTAEHQQVVRDSTSWLVKYTSQYRDECSMRANRHRWQTIWLQTEDRCFPFWVARRRPEAAASQALPQSRFFREFGNYYYSDKKVREDAKGQQGCYHLPRDIHFPRHPRFSRPATSRSWRFVELRKPDRHDRVGDTAPVGGRPGKF